MEPRSRETTPTKEDLDFIVDDGYRHDVDPDYVPNEYPLPDYIPKERYLVTGPEFKKLTRNAKKLGAESLDYSTRKNNKYRLLFQVEKKFILDRQNIPTTLFTKIKTDEINIFLELQRLKTNRES